MEETLLIVMSENAALSRIYYDRIRIASIISPRGLMSARQDRQMLCTWCSLPGCIEVQHDVDAFARQDGEDLEIQTSKRDKTTPLPLRSTSRRDACTDST
jgi:hypothetical protein